MSASCVRFAALCVVAACGGGAGGARRAAPVASLAPAPAAAAGPGEVAPEGAGGGAAGDVYAHAGRSVTARLLEHASEAEEGYTVTSYELELRFSGGGGETAATLANGTGEGCDDVSFFLEAAPGLDDPRLAMVNLLCDRGEDFLTREVVTALVFVGDDDDAPAVLWEGTGTFTSEMGACVSIDVAMFRRGAAGEVEAAQWTEVRRVAENPLPEGLECAEQPRAETPRATIDVPPAP